MFRELQLRVPQADSVSVSENLLVNLQSVDKRSSCGSQVNDDPVIPAAEQVGVVPGDGRVINANIGHLVASQAQAFSGKIPTASGCWYFLEVRRAVHWFMDLSVQECLLLSNSC